MSFLLGLVGAILTHFLLGAYHVDNPSIFLGIGLHGFSSIFVFLFLFIIFRKN